MIHVRDETGLAKIANVYVRDAGGLSRISAVRVRDANGRYDVLQSLKVTLSAPSVSGYAASNASVQITTDYVEAVVTGGTVASISWTFDLGAWTATNPGSLTTSFRSPPVAAADSVSTTATITVTDTDGNTASASVAVSAFNYGA